ncbi:MAG: hypothetical protein IT365_01505 [Candidatus Hydrogenedentes bacterium]|nr:hypothetical protein [Candidatus Hydrogenedentota bacterium]
MSVRGRSEATGIYLRIAGAVVIVLIAGLAGLWVGSLGTSETAKTRPVTPVPGVPVEESETQETIPPPPAPLYFYASVQPGADLEAVSGEVAMAAKAGIHDHVLRVALPWPEQGPAVTETLYPLDRIEQADPQANIILAITMNPPDAWLAAHPEAAASDGIHPSVTSEVWLNAGREALSELLNGIEHSERGDRISGFMLGGLEEDRWQRSGDYDRSPANEAGFRAWLRTQYPDELALRQAWGNDTLGFDDVTIPERPNTLDTQAVFFAEPGERIYVDFLRYVSESTADAISNFSAQLHQSGARVFKVFVPYGYSFELTANDTGHCALALLLDGVVDGFVSPVSYVDRGLGGAGGFMGPVDSAGYHGKQWLILDDTRTGISRNAVSGEIERIEGLRTEDVLHVQRRNYSAALARGLGLLLADADGVGSLHDARMWEEFGKMREAYQTVWTSAEVSKGYGFVNYPTPSQRLGLTVVVDEPSRFYQRCDLPLNRRLLSEVRDSALRAGVPTQFSLLQDVLDRRAAPSLVYIFANAFHLHAEDRARLQDVLISQNSAAIWLYAPGFIDETSSPENIALTTGFQVKQFDKPTLSGSVYQLSDGRWIEKDEEFGAAETWSPLFYIETEPNKALAKYRDGGQVSVAVEFFEEGWASIYVAEPALPAHLLREILTILEEHLFVKPGGESGADVFHFGPGFFAVHAGESGERELDLGASYDVQDMLDPNIGWLDKQQLILPMKLGETKILRVQTPQAHLDEPEQDLAGAEAALEGLAVPATPPPPAETETGKEGE